MTTIVINENSDEGRMLMQMLRAAQHASDAVVSIEGDEDENDESNALPFERIPGLPYTDVERIASVRRSIEDYERTGIAYTMEEMRAKHPRL